MSVQLPVVRALRWQYLWKTRGKYMPSDQSPAKVRLIEAGAERLGLSMIQTRVRMHNMIWNLRFRLIEFCAMPLVLGWELSEETGNSL